MNSREKKANKPVPDIADYWNRNGNSMCEKSQFIIVIDENESRVINKIKQINGLNVVNTVQDIAERTRK